MLDAGSNNAYLTARMKRLLALFALVLGMTSLVAPAHARVTVSAECSESSGHQNTAAARSDQSGKSIATKLRQRRARELGAPPSRSVRTVLMPTVMLVDRPLE